MYVLFIFNMLQGVKNEQETMKPSSIDYRVSGEEGNEAWPGAVAPWGGGGHCFGVCCVQDT